MRIDNNSRVGGVGGRPTSARSAAGGVFELGQGAPASQSRPAATIAATTGIDALLALQAVEDPLLRRRKLVRRGTQLLDALEGMKADLLAGTMSEGRLNQLMAVMSQARENSDPELDSLLDEIELRARVELAKRGLYPG